MLGARCCSTRRRSLRRCCRRWWSGSRAPDILTSVRTMRWSPMPLYLLALSSGACAAPPRHTALPAPPPSIEETIDRCVAETAPRLYPPAPPLPAFPDVPPAAAADSAVVDTSQLAHLGRLPPEHIKHRIRSSFRCFRACYESALLRDPRTNGTVGVRFVIDERGRATNAQLLRGTMPDVEMNECVLRVYRRMSFPKPEGGSVLVSYPIDFQSEP